MRFSKEYFTSHYRKQFEINFFKKIAYQSYVKYLFKLKQGTLLDCGCGIGNFLLFAEQKFKTKGFDISEYAISQAKSRLTHSELWVASATKKIQLENETVDVITAFDIVEHLIDHEHFFIEVKRILAHQSIFLIRTPNLNSWALRKKGEKWFGYRDKTHISLKTRNDWINILNNIGFDIIETGSDLIWDTPIFTKIPNIFQKILFKGSKFLFQLFKPFASVNWGGNLIIICRKS